MPIEEVGKSAILSARTLIEKEPTYSFVTARLLLDTIRKEVLGEEATQTEMVDPYAEYFRDFVKEGISRDCSNEVLAQFDLERLGTALNPERDLQFAYLGLQTLYDRYFLQIDGTASSCRRLLHARGDGPLARRESTARHGDRVLRGAVVLRLHDLDADAVQRRHLPLAALVLLPHHRRGRPAASSRRSTTTRCCPNVPAVSATTGPMSARSARISRAPTARCQGVVPFLKVVNDTAVAVNQGGKRKGAVLRLPRVLAHRHRGVPRASQEHR